MSNFPFADWQFWVVTVAAVGSVWALVRPFVGSAEIDTPGQGPCAKCGTTTGGGGGCGQTGTSAPKLVTLGGHRNS